MGVAHYAIFNPWFILISIFRNNTQQISCQFVFVCFCFFKYLYHSLYVQKTSNCLDFIVKHRIANRRIPRIVRVIYLVPNIDFKHQNYWFYVKFRQIEKNNHYTNNTMFLRHILRKICYKFIIVVYS